MPAVARRTPPGCQANTTLPFPWYLSSSINRRFILALPDVHRLVVSLSLDFKKTFTPGVKLKNRKKTFLKKIRLSRKPANPEPHQCCTCCLLGPLGQIDGRKAWELFELVWAQIKMPLPQNVHAWNEDHVCKWLVSVDREVSFVSWLHSCLIINYLRIFHFTVHEWLHNERTTNTTHFIY